MLKIRRLVIAIGTVLCLFGALSLYQHGGRWSAPRLGSGRSSQARKASSEASTKPKPSPKPFTPSPGKLGEVEQAFQHAWNGYSTYCFGHDSLHPVSNNCDDDFSGLGATAIDALSTAIIMQHQPAVLQILTFITTLDFRKLSHQHTKIQSFEVIIRHFGGMISAYDLLTGPFDHLVDDPELLDSLYDQMIELGDILTCSFETGKLGIPRGWVDPNKCITDAAVTNTIAGVGTMILEFARLSDITGVKTYVELASRAEDYLLKVHADGPYPGLLGSEIKIKTGDMANRVGGWGAPSDSYYEYLLKAYVYDQKTYARYLDAWKMSADSTIRFIASSPYAYPNWTLLPSWNGNKLAYRMDSLSWFAGGNFIYGGMITRNTTLLNFGISIADTAGAIYNMTATGLGPEYVSWKPECATGECTVAESVMFTDTAFKLRPEVLETWYYAYRATKEPKYREWSWKAFEAINKYCRTPSGFSAISNVDAPDGGSKTDMQESFVFAEVLKYIWLILADDTLPFHVHDSRTGKLKNAWVLNTEAHPLRVAGTPV